MTTRNHIGKSIFIATALPSTNDTTGFEALTWVEINGAQSLPQLGITHATIDAPDLKSGFTKGIKGAGSGVDTQMSFRDVPSDTGQTNVETTANSASGACSLKIATGSGTDNAVQTGDPVEYAQGYLHSFAPIQPDTTTHEGFTVGFRQNEPTVKGTEPA